MMFSRVSVEFGTSPPLTSSSSPSLFSPLVDVNYDEVAGDIGLQYLSLDEINCVGYFSLVSGSPLLPGAFSCTVRLLTFLSVLMPD